MFCLVLSKHLEASLLEESEETEGDLPTLIEIVKKSEGNSMGEILGDLAKTSLFENLFKSFTLMKASRSLHDASPIYPRVIGFGGTARTIITFNGHPTQKGYYGLEVAGVVDRKIEFREIIVKADLPQDLKNLLQGKWFEDLSDEDLQKGFLLERQDIEGGFEDDRILVTRANPQKCFQCHGVGHPSLGMMKFLWPQYNLWTGAFGEDDDKLDIIQSGSLTTFKESSKKNDRYNHLSLSQSKAFPYYLSSSETRTYATMPNHRLNMLLSFRYAEALANFFGLKLGRILNALKNPPDWKRSIEATCGIDFEWWRSFYKPLLGEAAMSLSPEGHLRHKIGFSTFKLGNDSLQSLFFLSYLAHVSSQDEPLAALKEAAFRDNFKAQLEDIIVDHLNLPAPEFIKVISRFRLLSRSPKGEEWLRQACRKFADVDLD